MNSGPANAGTIHQVNERVRPDPELLNEIYLPDPLVRLPDADLPLPAPPPLGGVMVVMRAAVPAGHPALTAPRGYRTRLPKEHKKSSTGRHATRARRCPSALAIATPLAHAPGRTGFAESGAPK